MLCYIQPTSSVDQRCIVWVVDFYWISNIVFVGLRRQH